MWTRMERRKNRPVYDETVAWSDVITDWVKEHAGISEISKCHVNIDC